MTHVHDVSGLILRAVLSIYMEDPSLPLPTPEEVLVCNPSTTAEEVTLITHELLIIVVPEKRVMSSLALSLRSVYTVEPPNKGQH